MLKEKLLEEGTADVVARSHRGSVNQAAGSPLAPGGSGGLDESLPALRMSSALPSDFIARGATGTGPKYLLRSHDHRWCDPALRCLSSDRFH